jgi:site-specific DNA recombinase
MAKKDGGARQKRAAVYLRVSSQKQVDTDLDPEGLSLPSQRKRCEAEAKKLGAEVIREYVEPGISGGSVLKRKAFKQLLTDIEEHRDIDVVIIWNVARWARDEIDQWSAFGILQRHGVEVASASEPIDSSPTGMLVFGIMGAIAAHERRRLAIEVTRGLTQKVEVGGTPGLAPLGYCNVTKEIDGRQIRDVELDPVRAPLVQDAFRLYATGDYSLAELATILEARGLRSRATKRTPEQALGINRLSSLLHNPYYIGLVRYDGKTYEGRHKPLVDEAAFQQVQDLLESKRQSGERSWRHHHYLRGSLYCAECGGRLTWMRTRGNGGQYEYFSCSGRSRGACSQGYHRAAAVEAAIERHYGTCEDVQLSDEDRDGIRRAVRVHVGEKAGAMDEKIGEAKAELAQLAGQERKLLQAHYADQVSPELFAEEQARIRRERAGAQQRLDDLSVDHGRILDALEAALSLTEDMERAYVAAKPQERRLLNQAFFKRLEIDAEEVVGYELAEPFASLRDSRHAASSQGTELAHLEQSWSETPARPRYRAAEPCAGARKARTPGPFSRTEGSNVESLVRLRGVEPPRSFLHTDLNRARLPVPPQPREQAIYRLPVSRRSRSSPQPISPAR